MPTRYTYQADLSSNDEKRIADSSYMEILERDKELVVVPDNSVVEQKFLLQML